VFAVTVKGGPLDSSGFRVTPIERGGMAVVANSELAPCKNISVLQGLVLHDRFSYLDGGEAGKPQGIRIVLLL
jgi:hypothetical protein